MSSGGSGSPVVTQTKSQDPWSGAQPFLSEIFANAQALHGQGVGYVPYTGQTQADVNPILTGGLGGINALAGQQAQMAGPNPLGGLVQAQDLYSQIAQNAQNPDPYVQQVVNQQISNVNAAASGAGRYGSADYDAAVAQAIAPTLMQDYAARQQRLGQAAQGMTALAPVLQQQEYAPYQAMTDVGQFYQQRAQQQLQDQINIYNAQQAWPWQQLERYNAILAGAGQLGGQQVSTSTQQVPFGQRLLGGGLAGAGLGSAFGPIGAGVGGLGGALLGGFL